MKNIRKDRLFPQLPRLVLAVGIGVFLLVSIVLFFSLAVPDCGSASAVCNHYSTIIKTENNGFEGPASPQVIADSIACPGSTGWTGASCVHITPTPPGEGDCMPWPQCVAWNFP